MAEKYLSGRTFMVLLSTNAFVDTYTLVCLVKQSLDRERSVNKQDTQCGLAKSFGSVDRTMTLECVTDLTPDPLAANVGEASYKLLSGWFEAGTSFRVKRLSPNPGGTEQYMESEATIVKMSDAADVGNNQSFTITLELTGTFDETP